MLLHLSSVFALRLRYGGRAIQARDRDLPICVLDIYVDLGPDMTSLLLDLWSIFKRFENDTLSYCKAVSALHLFV